MKELMWEERHGGAESPHVYYVLGKANENEPPAAILYMSKLLWHISVWNNDLPIWIEHEIEYTNLDEAKAVALALAAMEEK